MNISLLCNIEYGLFTSKGRRDENEDFLMVQEGKYISSFMVADGVGGCSFGKECSKITAEAMKGELESIEEFSADYVKLLLGKKYKQINSYFYNLSLNQDAAMATTASMLNFLGNNYILSNIGDTKIFLLRKNNIKLISKVHTVAYEEYESKKITYKQFVNHNKKHILTKAIGANDHIEPYMFVGTVMDDDIFIICSDGVDNYVSIEYISEVFKINNIERNDNLNYLCEQVVNKEISNGSNDNLSIIAIHIINE